MSYINVAKELANAHASSTKHLDELFDLIYFVNDDCDRVGWLTRGSTQRRLRRAIKRYAAATKKLQDAYGLLGEATSLVGAYISIIGDPVVTVPDELAKHLKASKEIVADRGADAVGSESLEDLDMSMGDPPTGDLDGQQQPEQRS